MITALEALEDVYEHRYNWLAALIETKKRALDLNDVSFWKHEIDAFGESMKDIKELLDAPKTEASTLQDICDALDVPGLSGNAVTRIKFLLEQQEELLNLKVSLASMMMKFK